MSEQTVGKEPNQKELPDYFLQLSNLLYALAGLLFLGGLWADWKMSGEVIISPLAIADEPEANSGLFLAAIIILTVGYLVAKVGLYIEERRKEKVDQTQEWTVDI